MDNTAIRKLPAGRFCHELPVAEKAVISAMEMKIH